VWRWTRRLATLVVALVAAALVILFTADLGRIHIGGQSLRTLAERTASDYLRRPMHIGSIRALITPGDFELRDVVIEGVTAEHRPFLRADALTVHVPWWTLLRPDPELNLEVRMNDWDMLVETWSEGPYRHNLPRLAPDRREPAGPRPFRTTIRFVYARDGRFTYEDHGVPWSVVAPSLSFDFVRADPLNTYVGTARFEGGTVRIQDFEPMAADMTTRFSLDGGLVQLQHIDLVTDGAVSHINGVVDFSHWPEQTYNVSSTMDFGRMREIFFARENWDLQGEGEFHGVFHLFDGGRSLIGQFASDRLQLDDLVFPDLHGVLEWLPDRFAVTHAESTLDGGRTRFSYALSPLGTPTGATASFHANYEDVDLSRLIARLGVDPIALDGTAEGTIDLQWPNGHFSSALVGSGRTVVAPPEGEALAPADLPADVRAGPREPAPFDPTPLAAPVSLGANLSYRFTPDRLTFEDSWVATPTTFVAFSGTTAYGEASEFPFQVTSLDWQASDRLLAAILTVFGASTNAVEVGGYGTFDGAMTGSFRAPRVAGRFRADAMRAWDVEWGRATGDLVIENSYLDIAEGVIGDPEGAHIRADGRFSLGFPRADGGEEIDARVVVTTWPLADLRHAFGLDDWPVDGTVGLADLQLVGAYRGPTGDGTLRIADGVAWGEHFASATGTLAFETTGLRINPLEMRKDTGVIEGAAWVGWNGTYSFDAAGDRIPVQALDNFRFVQPSLTGLLNFKSTGAGAFDDPQYEFIGTVPDLAIGEEGIGQVTGHLTVADDVLTIVQLDGTSSRLQVTGGGQIALNESSDAELRFRFFETSIDPYLKYVAPEVSPYTRIIASGTVRVLGPLGDPTRLLVDTTVDDAAFTLFDYDLRNDGAIHLTLADDEFRIGSLRLAGPDTELAVAGGIDFGARTIDLAADGQANLAIMQLFFTDLSASGSAVLAATVEGTLDEPQLRGQAEVAGGSIRHFSLPHSLTDINGPIRFDPTGINVSALSARMGDGEVTFEGSITLRGYRPEEFNLAARGTSMRLRYPEGLTSTVNADLLLSGPINEPLLSGLIQVLNATYAPRLDEGFLSLAAGGAVGVPGGGGEPTPEAFPLRFDIDIVMPPTPVIRNRDAIIEASATLHYSGTLGQPGLTGQIVIERGEVFFTGNRYVVRRGFIDFLNPNDPQPVFDIEAETRPRAAGQTFTVTVQVSGTLSDLQPTLTSDPWLPQTELLALLFGGTPDLGRAEQLALGSPQLAQERLLQTAGAVLLTSPLSSRIGTAFTDVLPLDTVQITPILGFEGGGQQLNPTARVTLGRRISSRVYLTYSRAFNDAQSEIILLEYEQSDLVSWILSRNEDRTFALDFRIRHVF